MKLTEIQEYFNPSLYEMSNFNSNTTGLPSGIKLWVREEPTGLPHTKYRIKLSHPQYGSAVFALWGEKPEQVAGDWSVSGKNLTAVVNLLSKTHKQIRAHIDGELDTAELVDVLRTAKENIND